MIDRQIDSRIPMPCDFVVKNDSKMRPASFASIPVPESSIATRTPSGPSGRDSTLRTRGRSDTERRYGLLDSGLRVYPDRAGRAGGGVARGAGRGQQPLGDRQGYLNLKAYREFDAQHRADGWNAWLTFSISPAAPVPSRPMVAKN